MPREGEGKVSDLLRDEIEIVWSEVDMQVSLKSDGMPTYHLANVVDDHHMEITTSVAKNGLILLLSIYDSMRLLAGKLLFYAIFLCYVILMLNYQA